MIEGMKASDRSDDRSAVLSRFNLKAEEALYTPRSGIHLTDGELDKVFDLLPGSGGDVEVLRARRLLADLYDRRGRFLAARVALGDTSPLRAQLKAARRAGTTGGEQERTAETTWVLLEESICGHRLDRDRGAVIANTR